MDRVFRLNTKRVYHLYSYKNKKKLKKKYDYSIKIPIRMSKY